MPGDKPIQLTSQDIDYILSIPKQFNSKFSEQVIKKVLGDEELLKQRRIRLTTNDILVLSHGIRNATDLANEILNPFVSGPLQAQKYDSQKIDEYKQKSPKLVLWFVPSVVGGRLSVDYSATELENLHKNLQGQRCKIFVVFTYLATNETGSITYSSKIPGIFSVFYNIDNGHILKIKSPTDLEPNKHYIGSRNKLHRHFDYRQGYDPEEDPPRTNVKIVPQAEPAFVPTPKKSSDDPLRTQGAMATTIFYACLFT